MYGASFVSICEKIQRVLATLHRISAVKFNGFPYSSCNNDNTLDIGGQMAPTTFNIHGQGDHRVAESRITDEDDSFSK